MSCGIMEKELRKEWFQAGDLDIRFRLVMPRQRITSPFSARLTAQSKARTILLAAISQDSEQQIPSRSIGHLCMYTESTSALQFSKKMMHMP